MYYYITSFPGLSKLNFDLFLNINVAFGNGNTRMVFIFFTYFLDNFRVIIVASRTSYFDWHFSSSIFGYIKVLVISFSLVIYLPLYMYLSAMFLLCMKPFDDRNRLTVFQNSLLPITPFTADFSK